jgi:hypothetical protein
MKNMKGYKGFEKGLICRGKQYAENTVFEEEKAVICNSGMHFCENPFDVLDYYGLVNDDGSFNDFAEVEALDKAETDDKKKYCTTKLRVGAKLSFAGFVKACVDFVMEKTKEAPNGKDEAVISSKARGAQICSSGYGAQIGSSGDGAKIGSSGDGAKIGSSGYGAQIGSSGYGAQIGSSGYGAQIGSSGDWAQIGSSGKNAVVMCAGNNSVAKAKIGSWITLSEWKQVDGVYTPVCVKTEKVDGERIKEDTFYALVSGEFVEVNKSGDE